MKKLFALTIFLSMVHHAQGKPGPSDPDPKDRPYIADPVMGIANGSFFLVNSTTDQAIAQISDGDTFYLDIVGGSLNIQAVPSQSYDQVRFTTSDGFSLTEGVAPYAYKGDISGDYNDWAPALGSLSFTVEYRTGGATVQTDTFTLNFQQAPPDTQLPTAPLLSTTAKTDTTVDLAWSGATDNVGVTGYRLFRDGALEATLGSVGSHQATGLSPSTAYSFTVRALDAAGNESPNSNALSITTDPAIGGGGNWSLSGSTVFYNGGNVGIGTSNPGTYKLAVNGNVHAKEVKVDLVGWADHVFKKGYDLPSLEEVEKHIKEKGHLPNIPSAAEVETNGIELGEMNRLLLAKIEELTLYLLEQEKRVKAIESKVADH